MKESVAIEGGLSLFLLEEEGILFSEGQQELYVLNTPATYVWCCLEEGLAPGQISAAFSSSFDVPLDQAKRTIGDLLSRWQAFGYLRGVPDTAHSEIDWTTAVARLMASPSLREEFEESPAAVAKKLRVASPDRKAFVALSPPPWNPKRYSCRRRNPRSRSNTFLGADNSFFGPQEQGKAGRAFSSPRSTPARAARAG